MLDIKKLFAKLLTYTKEVKSTIQELTVGVDVSSKVTVSSAWSVSYKRFIKRGKRIDFEFEGYCTSYIANHTYDMLFLANDIKPKSLTAFLGHRTDGAFVPQGFHTVIANTNARIQVTASSTVGSYWFASGWYEIA